MASTPNITKNWSANQFKFIEWLALPKKQRKPATQAALAKEIGVDPATLSDWKRQAGFMEEVTALARAAVRDALADIYAALVTRAIDGDVPAIKLVLEVTREFTPRQELQIDVTKMSDDELQRIVES